MNRRKTVRNRKSPVNRRGRRPAAAGRKTPMGRRGKPVRKAATGKPKGRPAKKGGFFGGLRRLGNKVLGGVNKAINNKVGVKRLVKRNNKIERIQEQKGNILRKLKAGNKDSAEKDQEIKTLMALTETTLTNLETSTEKMGTIVESIVDKFDKIAKDATAGRNTPPPKPIPARNN